MNLKYDVYYEIGDFLTFTQLIPKKKMWKIKLDDEHKSELALFLRKIEAGINDNELSLLLKESSQYVNSIFTFLKLNYLVSNFNSHEYNSSPFFRQLEVFDSWDRKGISPLEYQKKLIESSVFIIGAGGTGTSLANILNSCGVGNLFIADYDCIEISNLSRQFLYTINDIGQKKTETIANYFCRRGLGYVKPITERITLNNVNQLLERAGKKIDIVTGLPLPTNKSTLDLYKTILDTGTPILSIGEHDVGPLFFCYEDVLNFLDYLQDSFILQKQHNERRNSQIITDRHPSYLPEISIVCSIGADEIIRYISGYAPIRTYKSSFGLETISYKTKYVTMSK